MVSMEMSAEEAKEYATAPGAEAGSGPKYPYGLRLCLDDDALEKLGIHGLPSVGTRLTIAAIVTVTATRSSEDAEGEAENGVDLQITDMEIGMPPSEVDANRLYKGA